MYIFEHAECQMCCVKGIVGSVVDCVSEGSDSWWYLATSLHVPERLDTCDFTKAGGSFYEQFLHI